MRLEIDVPLATWEQARRVYTTNISKGGLLFELEGPTTMPAEIALSLTLPDGKQVNINAEVHHVARTADGKRFDVGVQFTQLDGKDRPPVQRRARQYQQVTNLPILVVRRALPGLVVRVATAVSATLPTTLVKALSASATVGECVVFATT